MYCTVGSNNPNWIHFTGNSVGNVLAADTDNLWFQVLTLWIYSSNYMLQLNASLYQTVTVEFDNDWQAIGATDFGYVEVSVDGGTTWTTVKTFGVTDVRNTHENFDISSAVST